MNKKITILSILFAVILVFGTMSAVSATLTDNIVSYYKLDESSGTTAFDSLGLYNLTNTGASTNQAGKINTGYYFNLNDTLSSLQIDYSKNYSFCMWANTTNTGSYKNLIYGGVDSGFENRFRIDNTDHLQWSTIHNTQLGGNGSVINDGNFHFLCGVRDAVKNIIYLDGVELDRETIVRNSTTISTHIGGIASETWTGNIDEVGFWNKTLTPTEITELYNSGFGLEYPFTGGLASVTLESPTNGTTISDAGTNFTAKGNNISIIGGTWNNVTFNVWENGTLFNQTTISLSSQNFTERVFIDSFSFSDYQWNAEACYTNVTGTYCVSALNNNTLTVSLFTIISESYVNDTISGTVENFSIEIDILEGYELSDADFIYNGTLITPEITSAGSNRFLLVSDYPIPIISLDENISFYWMLNFGNETLNSPTRTQLVRAVLMDNCSVYTNKVFNISLHDEVTKESLNGTIEVIYTLLNIPYYDEVTKIYYSISGVSSTEVCTALNLSGENLAYSAEIRYVSEGYAPELYHIQRRALPTSYETINLYDLNESKSTEFKITYQDSTFNFVEGAIVQLLRKYISEDTYEVVEAPLTSNEGIAVLHIDLDSVKYKAIVIKNGEVLDTFDNLVFKCTSELTGECSQKLLGEINPQNEINYDTERDFIYSVSESNGTVTITYSIPSGEPSTVNIQLTQTDQFGNTTLCNKNVTSSAGSIECTYSTTIGDSYLDLYIYKAGSLIGQQSYIIPEESGLDLLNNNFFIVLVLLLSLAGMAFSSPEWIVVNGIVTFVIAGALFLLNGVNFVVGLGSLFWLLVGGVILIFKLAKQEDR